MSKKKSAKAQTEEIVTAEVTPVVEETTAPVSEETTPAIEEAPAQTTVVAAEKPKGRPIVPGCARQKKLEERAKKAAEGKYVGRGRPIIEGSARQKRVAALNAKIAAGIEIKPGRPKMVKPEVVVVVNDPAPTTEVVETVTATAEA